MSDCMYLYTAFLEYPPKWLQRRLVVTWLSGMVPRKTVADLAHVLCTPCTSLQCHSKPRLRRVHVCLAVTCHVPFSFFVFLFFILLLLLSF